MDADVSLGAEFSVLMTQGIAKGKGITLCCSVCQ